VWEVPVGLDPRKYEGYYEIEIDEDEWDDIVVREEDEDAPDEQSAEKTTQ
jgi:hypothetical protein